MTRSQARARDLVTALRKAQGADYAGFWFDNETDRFTVLAVSGEDSASSHQARQVMADRDLEFSFEDAQWGWDQLVGAQEDLNRILESAISTSHVQTQIDVKRNALSVRLSPELTSSEARLVKEAARESYVTVVTTQGSRDEFNAAPATNCVFPNCDRPLRGGVDIGGCTAGYLAQSNANGDLFYLTAGHCMFGGGTSFSATHASTNVLHSIGPSSQWYTDNHGDAGLIRIRTNSFWYTNLAPINVVWGYGNDYPIYGAGGSYVGMFICGMGITTAFHCGYVTAMMETVYYGGLPATISRLTRVSGCVLPGDSGGPWDVAGYAVGMTSGYAPGANPCISWYSEALDAQTYLGTQGITVYHY